MISFRSQGELFKERVGIAWESLRMLSSNSSKKSTGRMLFFRCAVSSLSACPGASMLAVAGATISGGDKAVKNLGEVLLASQTDETLFLFAFMKENHRRN